MWQSSLRLLCIITACRLEGLGGMSHRWMKALPITYSLFSGMIGTQSVLFSKALSTLLRTTLDGDSQLDSWFFWIVLLLFLCCAYFWVTSLNKVGHAPENVNFQHPLTRLLIACCPVACAVTIPCNRCDHLLCSAPKVRCCFSDTHLGPQPFQDGHASHR